MRDRVNAVILLVGIAVMIGLVVGVKAAGEIASERLEAEATALFIG